MKRMTLQMTIVFALVFLLGFLNAADAKTLYVAGNGIGQDGWDGEARTYQGGSRGPKATINAAIEIASMSGDVIEVNYANGAVYSIVDPENTPDGTNAHKDKSITFTSYGGTPTVTEWRITAGTTTAFSGDFKIRDRLVLKNGNLSGGNFLTMMDGSQVVRTLGQISVGQLMFAGFTDFLYNGGTDVTTALEMPLGSNTAKIIRNVRVERDGSASPTILHLNESKQMNGVIDLAQGDCHINLETNTLTVNEELATASPAPVHENRGDILNGELVFNINNTNVSPMEVILNRNGILPNITVNSNVANDKLTVRVSGTVGRVTANGTAMVDLLNAANLGGLINNGTGTMYLTRTNITVDADSQVVANDGRIFFDNTGWVRLGHVKVNGGVVEFQDSDNEVRIYGDSYFWNGEWIMRGLTPNARTLRLGGRLNQFGLNSTNVDFSSTRTNEVELLVQPLGSITEQMVNGNKPGAVWEGTLRVNNNTVSPGVTFHSGDFIVMGDVLFERGLVQVDSCIVTIGQDSSKLRSDFTNTSGFTSANGGVVLMNGARRQAVSGNGDFGGFAVSNHGTMNNANWGVHVTGPITCKEYFYLTNGQVNGSGNITFDNAPAFPTIVRLNGTFDVAPVFADKVNLKYTGNQKTTDNELPQGPSEDKLHDFLIQTQNNTDCSNGYGWVRLNRNITVQGLLRVDEKQALIVNDGRTVTLQGATLDIRGYFLTVKTGKIAFGAPGGIELVTDGYLPSIVIPAGSMGNKIHAKGLRSQTFSYPTATNVGDFFCDPQTYLAALADGSLGIPGDITFAPNGVNQTSSLDVTFTDTEYDHIANLTTGDGATLTMMSDVRQWEEDMTTTGPWPTTLDHKDGATINIGDHTFTTKSNVIHLEGNAQLVSTEGGLFLFHGWDQTVNLAAFAGMHPTIDANVQVDLQTSTLALRDNSSDSLTVKKNFMFKKGTIELGGTSTPVDLALLGQKFELYGAAQFSTTPDGILYLNATNAPMMWHIYNGVAPTLNHLTIQKSVSLLEDGNAVHVLGNYLHEDGLVDLGSNDLWAKGTYTRVMGNYEATSGYLILDFAVSNNFVHNDADLTIPNLWVQCGRDINTIGDGYINITKQFYFKNIDGFLFKHDRKMNVSDGVTVFFHSGDFDYKPNYAGTIRLMAVHGWNAPGNPINKALPLNVWPEASGIVSTFGVVTNDTSGFDNNKKVIQLQGNYAVSDTLWLRNGAMNVAAGKTFTFNENLVIIRVDGSILAGSAIVNDKGGYHVIYKNNGQANVAAGLELPDEMHSLTFTRNADLKNQFTVLNKPVLVGGSNTLNIRNNVRTLIGAELTVLDDVYIENESDVFPQATDPLCDFRSPLVFAGGDNQMVYVPKNGVDIRPPANLNAEARIRIAKDSPANTVKVTGGDLIVDWIEFCNGLLDTDDHNSVHIPAPFPGQGQGFDRDCMEDGNISHAIGRITKHFKNDAANNEGNSSNEHQIFPVGSRDEYRPMAFTFRNIAGQVTIPPELDLTTQHVDTPPRGSQGIPMADNCGVTTNTYAPFYWYVESNGTYTQEEYDVEVAGSGLSNDGYDTVDQLRILRRHGNISETENTWLMQGDCVDYDNAQYTEGPTVINEHAKGGLREEGAIFTIGMPYGDLPVAKHFDERIVWDGNPYNAMTFYVTHADFWAGKPLQPGDEIAVYDGANCVGFVKLTQEVTPDNYAIIVASKDDDPMDNVTNGYTEGNKIYFRYWDSKTDTEYGVPDNAIEYYKVGADEREYNVVFEQRSTRVELFKGEPRVGGQEIWLTKGWNIFSLAVDPRDLNDPNSKKNFVFDTDTPNIFGQGILNPIEPQLIKVQDEDGNTIEVIFGNWQDNIEQWQETEGYYVKVTEDVQLEVLSNVLVESPTSIALGVGWNIISYPCLETDQDAIDVLQPLIDLGYLDKAMDQYGHALERLAFVTENNGWYNGIGTMKAGQGYYIKLNAPATLEINCPGQEGTPKLMAVNEPAEPQHFARDWGNPYMPMNIYITDVKLGGTSLAVGDEVAVYDGANLVGSVVVEEQPTKEKPIALVAGMDDGSGEGFAEGSGMTFKIWKSDLNQEIEIDANDVRFFDERGAEAGSHGFSPRATATVSISSDAQVAEVPTAFELKQNYPNPFNPSTTLSFAVPNDADVSIQVYDITGKLVTTLVNAKMSAGYHNIEWNGTDSQGLRVATGIYFYKMTAGNFVQTKKMLFAK